MTPCTRCMLCGTHSEPTTVCRPWSRSPETNRQGQRRCERDKQSGTGSSQIKGAAEYHRTNACRSCVSIHLRHRLPWPVPIHGGWASGLCQAVLKAATP